MLVEDRDVVGRQRAGFIQALQRFRRALERVQGLAEIAPTRRRARIGFDRRAEQALRLAELSLLQLDAAKEIERVEITRRGFEHARINLLGLAKPALAMQRDRLVERLTDVKGAGFCTHTDDIKSRLI